MSFALFLFWLILVSNYFNGRVLCSSSDYYDDYDDSDIVENKIIIPIVSVSHIKLENKVANPGNKSDIEHLANNFRKIITKLKFVKKLDIVFLIDASSSVGKENFQNEISFVKRLLTDFNVSLNHTRVSLISFSSAGKIVRI